ncbi:site-specific integrase [Dyella japonica]|uniref:GTP-binding protein LepA n=1 Tax=Dyella japonica DSM 16301 TaxID=1440762 RepID=A0A0G9H880_9GAMM|nr:site-specific integrase [Dyella japonica]KLD65459.1 GTP-binding protein LepA [Dyella japonica DSM 16301]
MATKRFKNGAWEFRIVRSGLLPKPVYVRFDNEQEGETYCRRVEALLDRGVVPEEFLEGRRESKLLRDHVRTYIETQHASEEDLKLLTIVLSRLPSDLQLSGLTFAWAVEWVQTMKREYNLAPSTIRHHVGALARALDWITAKGDLPNNPLRLLKKGYASYTQADSAALRHVEGAEEKEDNERDRRLEGDEETEIRKILAGEKPKGKERAFELNHAEALKLLFDTALESAMRMREMYTLSRRQVDLPKRTIFLDKTKNGDKRQVPISSVLLARLTPYMEGMRDNELLFPWWDGDLDKRVLARTTSRLSQQFARVFEGAGCGDLRFHDLRHEATSRLFERTTLSDMEIAKITGHKSMSMLRRYSNLRGSNLAERLW